MLHVRSNELCGNIQALILICVKLHITVALDYFKDKTKTWKCSPFIRSCFQVCIIFVLGLVIFQLQTISCLFYNTILFILRITFCDFHSQNSNPFVLASSKIHNEYFPHLLEADLHLEADKKSKITMKTYFWKLNFLERLSALLHRATY